MLVGAWGRLVKVLKCLLCWFWGDDGSFVSAIVGRLGVVDLTG